MWLLSRATTGSRSSGRSKITATPSRFFPTTRTGETSDFVEVPAGLIDEGEQATDAARREAHEEVGVKLDTLEPAGHTWSMCGVSTERMALYLAPYAVADRTSAGGGLVEEHENITVVEVSLDALRQLADANALVDLKTLALVQTLRLRPPQLPARPPTQGERPRARRPARKMAPPNSAATKPATAGQLPAIQNQPPAVPSRLDPA